MPLNSYRRTKLEHFISRSWFPLDASQMVTILALSPLTIKLPSGENPTEFTCSAIVSHIHAIRCYRLPRHATRRS